MFKNKIAVKLAAGFIAFVILCVSILGLLFINIFAGSHIKYRTNILLQTADQIAQMPEVQQMNGKQLQQESRFLEFLDYSADARIWVVDKNMNIVMRSTGLLCDYEEMGNHLLPQNDMNFMNQIFTGKNMISDYNINFYDIAMLSVGVPVYRNGVVVGAVLLHTPINSLSSPIRQTAWYLVLAILISMIIIIVAVWFYAASFTKPLKIMKEIAGKMIGGNYLVKTNIKQKDEIGELANAMDILADRLELAREESDKLEQIRRDFVANVSHEFRTPLTVIRGNLETLIDTKVEEPGTYYQHMLSETDALEKLVSDLLDLSRIESGKLEFTIEEVDIKSLLADTIRTMMPIAQQKAITIDTSGISDSIPPIQSDYYRLRQILIIFLSNAVKYSETNKIIHVSTMVADNLIIQIKDQGIGISKEDLPYIWDRFFKADKMRTDKTSTGLGLAIAKNLTNALGGDVTLDSEAGFGTTVKIILPFNTKEM